MIKYFTALIFFFGLGINGYAQNERIPKPFDVKTYANSIVKDEKTNIGKAKKLLHYLSGSFEWKSTDYQNRTIEEIILRKGGNCFELARVYMAMVEALDINYRPIAEVNLYEVDEARGSRARDKIKENGNRMSVFGAAHNDHRWVELYDDIHHLWIPVDPTMNLFGMEAWLKGRVWFGERKILNEEIGKNMIVPVAIFVTEKNNPRKILEDRSAYYLVKAFNNLYGGKMGSLKDWSTWEKGVSKLSPHVKAAFEGNENLHLQIAALEELKGAYFGLKAQQSALE